MKLNMEEILQYSPELPPKKYLTKLKFKQGGKKKLEQSSDKNLATRYCFIKALYSKYQFKDKKLVRYLLKQEIKYAQKVKDYTLGLNLSAFMLYTIMSVKDTKILFDAKFGTCQSAQSTIDIELIFGANKDLTKQYYQQKPDKKRKILKVIKEYEAKSFKTRQEYLKFYIEKKAYPMLCASY